MQYDWRILKVEVLPKYQEFEDVVSTVHWELSGSDEETGIIGYVSDKTSIEVEDIYSFIPYTALGPPQLIDWVISSLTEDQMTSYYNQIQTQIDQKKTIT